MFYRIGNLVIRSVFSIRKPRRGEDCLILKSRSFPPAHPSTKAALTILNRLEIFREARILDIGCGSGILGLAAALKNDTIVLGCDICAVAIKASMQNAALNRMQDRFHVFRGSVDAVSGSFNVILANLHAVTHMKMFDHYRRLLPLTGALLVISGFHDVQASYMEKELSQRGFGLIERVEVHSWAAALTEESSYTWVGFGFIRIPDNP